MSDATPPEDPVGSLKAGTATIVLIAYLASDLLCWLVAGAIAGIIAASEGSHSPGQIAAILNSLKPILVIMIPLVGIVVITMSARALFPKDIRETSPNGSAWVIGRSKDIWKALVIGAVLAAIAHVVNQVMKPFFPHSGTSYLTRMASTPGFPQICTIFGAVFLAPPLEELLFRGVLYGGYRRSFGRVWACAITTLGFVVLHFPEINRFPPGAVGIFSIAATALACRLHWKAIGPAVALHVGYNVIVASLLVQRSIMLS